MKEAIFALLTAFAISVVAAPFLIKALRYLKFGQTIREEGPKSHFKKAGTPTMGGLIFLLGFTASSLIWAGSSATVWVFVAMTLLYGLIGFVDDGIIIMMHRSLGLTAKQKLILQFAFAFVFLYFADAVLGRGTEIIFPIANFALDLGWFYYPLIATFMVFMVNAVNLTDGLDGLAGGITFLVCLGYVVIVLAAAATPPIAGLNYNALGISVAALAGGILGFLCFNKHPAKVFMGDTGSLALGGALSVLAVLTKTEVLLIVLGLVYIVEALSVVIQVFSFKVFGRRVFKMSPIHHHFEMCGWSERKIVAAFWTVAAICVILALFMVSL